MTCPCEENMEEWHRVKFNKYNSLTSAIKCNSWKTYLFPLEVGAKGYCSSTVRSCLLRLGLSNKVIRSTLKSLSMLYIKASFQIWLSRNNKDWQKPEKLPSQSKVPKRSSPVIKDAKTSNVDKKVFKKNSEITAKSNCGLFNKGNTCYLNSALQCFSRMVLFWSNLSIIGNQISPFVTSFVRIMSMLGTCKSAMDPSVFLRQCQSVIVKAGVPNFDLHQQQDVAEIIGYILDELFVQCAQSQRMISVSFRNSITCNSCYQSSSNEDVSSILRIPVANSIQAALDNILKCEELNGEDSYFCNVCNSFQPAALEHEVVSCGLYLIVQIKRFLNLDGSTTKDTKSIDCSPVISLPVVDPTDIRLLRQFKLIAVINHSGNLSSGHYTADISSNDSSTWWICNDAAVIESSTPPSRNRSCYICFYQAI